MTAVSYAWDATDRITQISNVRDTTALTTNISYTTEAGTGYELTTITDPELVTSKIRRDPASGKVMELEDGNGKKTVFTYYPVNAENTANGKSGMAETITGPDGVKTTVLTYDRNGNPLSFQATDANNNPVPVVTSLVHDALNRLRNITRTLTAQSKTLTATYDFDQYGSLTAKDPEQNANSTSGTRYDFNYNRNVKRITDALSGITELTYGGQSCPSCGGVDQLTAVKDPRQYALGASGKSTMFLYDKTGRLERETDPAAKVIRYTYYDNGLLKGKYDATSGDPGTLLMSYTYNNRGQLTEKLRNNGSKDSFTYKPNGFLDTATTRNSDNSVLISLHLRLLQERQTQERHRQPGPHHQLRPLRRAGAEEDGNILFRNIRSTCNHLRLRQRQPALAHYRRLRHRRKRHGRPHLHLRVRRAGEKKDPYISQDQSNHCHLRLRRPGPAREPHPPDKRRRKYRILCLSPLRQRRQPEEQVRHHRQHDSGILHLRPALPHLPDRHSQRNRRIPLRRGGQPHQRPRPHGHTFCRRCLQPDDQRASLRLHL